MDTNLNGIKARKVQKNNTSGTPGVGYHSSKGMWYARITYKGKTHSLGYFLHEYEAVAARKRAEETLNKKIVKKKKSIIDI